MAEDTAGRAVALKILHPELAVSVHADRFLREIDLLSHLDHPLITKVLDYGQREWLVYFAMEYAAGSTLRLVLDKVRRTSVADAVRLGDHLLDALAYAHGQGIVHRDVKPANIILGERGALLVDYGIARAIEAAGRKRITLSGFTVGTSAYMSPEQAAGLKTIDHRSDLYSLGCVLFECLAGRPPYVHRHEATVLQLQQSQPAPDVRRFRPDVPEPGALALLKAMAKRPERRWESANAMRKALTSQGSAANPS